MTKKEKILGALLIVGGALVGFLWPLVPSTPAWLLVIVVYTTLFGLFVLLAKNTTLFYAAPSVSVAAIGITLGITRWALVGTVLASLWTLMATKEARDQYESSLTLLVRRILGKSFRILFTALALLFAFSYYAALPAEPDANALLVPKEVFRVVVENTLPVIQNGNLSIGSNDLVVETLYDLYVAKINAYARRFASYIPAVLAISYFFALKAVSVVFYYLALGALALCIKALTALGLVAIEITETKKETLV